MLKRNSSSTYWFPKLLLEEFGCFLQKETKTESGGTTHEVFVFIHLNISMCRVSLEHTQLAIWPHFTCQGEPGCVCQGSNGLSHLGYPTSGGGRDTAWCRGAGGGQGNKNKRAVLAGPRGINNHVRWRRDIGGGIWTPGLNLLHLHRGERGQGETSLLT